MISRQLFSKSRGKPNCNNGLGFRNGVKCLPCLTIYHHFLCMSVLLCGGRFSNLALRRIKNHGCVAAFCAMYCHFFTADGKINTVGHDLNSFSLFAVQ